MGSLNDFNWPSEDRRSRRRFGFLGNLYLWIQIVLSVVLFLFVGQYINADDFKGDISRYVMGEGLSMENSWLSYDSIVPAVSEDSEIDPVFLMPLLGVAVRDFSLQSGEDGAGNSLLIQGENGQQVTSTAKGKVAYLEETVSGWIVKIDHDNGFQSVYQGLAGVEVDLNQNVNAGEKIGVIGDSPLEFSLLKGGAPEDPLKWLFKDELNDSVS